MRRWAAGLAAGALALTLLVGCAPSSEPSPTPTGFADEDAAFAAAEATYRAYVDALNRVDLSNPETFEEVYRWTTGDALAAIKRSLSTMHADGWRVSGSSHASVVQPMRSESGLDDVALAVCLNVSEVAVLNRDGESVVDSNRVDVQSMLIRVRHTPAGSAIHSIAGRDGAPSC